MPGQSNDGHTGPLHYLMLYVVEFQMIVRSAFPKIVIIICPLLEICQAVDDGDRDGGGDLEWRIVIFLN